MATRSVGAVLALAAAGCLATSAVTKAWWQRGGSSAGPLGAVSCQQGRCEKVEFPTKNNFKTLALVTAIASLAAAGFLAMVGVLGLAKKGTKVPGIIALAAAVAALGAGAFWVSQVPGGDPMKGMAWGAFLFGGGGVVGIVAAVLLMRAGPAGYPMGAPMSAPATARTLMLAETAKAQTAGPEAKTMAPGVPVPMAAAPKPSKGSPAMVPPCPSCHGPLQFAAAFKSWYCPRCQRYVTM